VAVVVERLILSWCLTTIQNEAGNVAAVKLLNDEDAAISCGWAMG
jgi:hypothetical protein